jgi:hypothetical protein
MYVCIPTRLVRRKHAPLAERLVHALAEGAVQVQEQLHHHLSTHIQSTHTHKVHTKRTQSTHNSTREERGDQTRPGGPGVSGADFTLPWE